MCRFLSPYRSPLAASIIVEAWCALRRECCCRRPEKSLLPKVRRYHQSWCQDNQLPNRVVHRASSQRHMYEMIICPLQRKGLHLYSDYSGYYATIMPPARKLYARSNTNSRNDSCNSTSRNSHLTTKFRQRAQQASNNAVLLKFLVYLHDAHIDDEASLRRSRCKQAPQQNIHSGTQRSLATASITRSVDFHCAAPAIHNPIRGRH